MACQILYTEIEQVLRRTKFKKYIAEQDITNFEAVFREYALEISLETKTEGARRDKNDDFLLALAQDGQADYLVTGDKDLLVLGTFAQTQIISLRHFTEHILPLI